MPEAEGPPTPPKAWTQSIQQETDVLCKKQDKEPNDDLLSVAAQAITDNRSEPQYDTITPPMSPPIVLQKNQSPLPPPPPGDNFEEVLKSLETITPDMFEYRHEQLNNSERETINAGIVAANGKSFSIFEVNDCLFMTRAEALMRGRSIRRLRLPMISPINFVRHIYEHMVEQKAAELAKINCIGCQYVDPLGCQGHPSQCHHSCLAINALNVYVEEAQCMITVEALNVAIDLCVSMIRSLKLIVQHLRAAAIIVADRNGNVPEFDDKPPQYLKTFFNNYLQ